MNIYRLLDSNVVKICCIQSICALNACVLSITSIKIRSCLQLTKTTCHGDEIFLKRLRTTRLKYIALYQNVVTRCRRNEGAKVIIQGIISR